MFITRFLLELANSYRANISYAGVNARKLLDEELAIYVLPCVNPDGYEMTQFSGSIKSNLPAKGIKNLSSAKSNANLADLNRNFPNYSSAVLGKPNIIAASPTFSSTREKLLATSPKPKL